MSADQIEAIGICVKYGVIYGVIIITCAVAIAMNLFGDR